MANPIKNLFTLIVSGAILISSTLGISLDTPDSSSFSVKEETSAKVSSQEQIKELSVNGIDESHIFDGISGKKSPSSNETGKSETKSTSAQTSSPTSNTSAAASTTSATNAKTTKATTKTTVKIPEDESKNNNYIKDPDYKSPYYIVVYTGSQSTVVYGKDDNGNYTRIVQAFTVSTGRKNSTPTRKGLYKIRAKYRWRTLMGPCYGQYCSSISPDYLFHSVPYDKRRPDTLYNASYNNLGKAVSHGCIRMCVRDVKWIYDNCPIGTQVHVVWDSGPAGKGVPKRKSGSKYSGWDPSDEWSEGNPYFKDEKTSKTTTTTTKSDTTTTKKSQTVTSNTKKTSTTTSSATKKTETTTSTTTTAGTTTSKETKKTSAASESNPTEAESSNT